MIGRRRSTASADIHIQAETTLFLLDRADDHTRYISREHFSIEYDEGRFSVVDLRSTCGTIVAGRRIGGNREGGQGELHDQDEIVIGTASSRYAFRFEVCTD
jgi:pSer/pThr/pTyr-binding forkhead associated (FHA) protein